MAYENKNFLQTPGLHAANEAGASRATASRACIRYGKNRIKAFGYAGAGSKC